MLNLQQVQKQSQRLIMTPQMQQSIQLLQLNTIELEQMLETELLENPFLTVEEDRADDPEDREREEPKERDDDEPASPDDYDDMFDPPAESKNGKEEAPAETPQPENKSEAEANAGEDSSANTANDDEPTLPDMESAPEQFEEVDLNWDDYYSDAENPTYFSMGEETEERDFSEYVAAKTSLADELHWQLRCSSLEGLDVEICEYLIGSINEDGYLPDDIVADAAGHFEVEPEVVERVLTIFQEFDPPGIGARSLNESLVIQMHQNGSYTPLAEEVIMNHFDAFQRKKYREIARKIDADEDDLIALHAKVARLQPHPGRSLTTDSTMYITPDVTVRLIDGEMMIYLNEGRSSNLSVDRFYRRLMRQMQKALTRKEREFALEKYRAALTLIKNIEKRKSTILRVTEAIMEVQRPFLEKGVEALRPLTLREIADAVQMHESTVARVTSSKYVETPQGTFSLKYFFSSSIESKGNEAVSSRSIKDKLRQIIDDENPRKPLSDQKIAEMLADQGFDIARRTVAKYREQLKILPAKYRKQS